MKTEEYRISALRDYLFEVLKDLTDSDDSKINADMLEDNIDSYSIDKIPTASIVTSFINGMDIKRDVYSIRSRRQYSEDEINNLNNIGFFEKFEEKITYNNKKRILPKIENILTIGCLNAGTLNQTESHTAIFDIQLEITYIKEENDETYSEKNVWD